MHNLEVNVMNYYSHLKALFADLVNSEDNFRRYRRNPKASDLFIISLKLASESMGINSENNLYHRLKANYPKLLSLLPDRSNFNRRCKSLVDIIDMCAQRIIEIIAPDENKFIVDSTPLPICRNARIPRLKIMRDDPEMLPARGWSACDRSYFYGYKLHLLISPKGLIFSFFITTENIHDSDLTMDLYQNTFNSDVYGDKGYINKYKQLDLFENFNITLITPSRKNAKQPNRKWNNTISVQRKRIETFFSQFADQFGIKRNFTKSFEGFYSRIVAKITSMTFLQYVNYLNDNPIGQIKNLCVN